MTYPDMAWYDIGLLEELEEVIAKGRLVIVGKDGVVLKKFFLTEFQKNFIKEYREQAIRRDKELEHQEVKYYVLSKPEEA